MTSHCDTVCAGSGKSSSDHNDHNPTLEQLLSSGSDDTGHGVQPELQRLRVKAPTVPAVALTRQMLIYIEKAGIISPPFEVPLEIKITFFEQEGLGPSVLDEQQQGEQQQSQQLGLINKVGSMHVSKYSQAKVVVSSHTQCQTLHICRSAIGNTAETSMRTIIPCDAIKILTQGSLSLTLLENGAGESPGQLPFASQQACTWPHQPESK